MSSPEKKEPSSALKSNVSPSLPDDLLLSCIACVSRLYYPTLSLVSKRLRSLIDSPELYKARSLLRHTESCLYVCMDFNSDRNRRWFTLCRKPDETLTNDTRKKKKKKKKPSGYVLAKVPMPQSPPVNVSGHGLVEGGSSINNNFYSESGCIDGMFKLELVERGIHHDMYSDSYCEIENVLYSVSVSDGAFRWYDTKENMWREIVSYVGLPKFPHGASVRVANYGGNMAVFWDESLPYGQTFRGHRKKIWCAEIALERRCSCVILGEVEWSDIVLLVPAACDLVKVLAATA